MCTLFTKRKEKLRSLNKQLSRLDVEKDAIKTTNRITYGLPYFRQIANTLFGPLGSYESTYNDIERQIECLTEIVHPPPRICNLDKKFTNASHISSFITHCIQDSGVSPEFFKYDITHLITPGSYLDPCKRSWGSYTELFGFDITLTKENAFDHLQLPIELLYASNDAHLYCNVSIDFGFHKLSLLFDRTFNAYNQDAKEYFSTQGNVKKNDWFNTNTKNDIVASLHILCKEMGDMLQAYYGKLFIAKQPFNQRNTLALFTCDKLLSRRFQLLGVPVVRAIKENNQPKNMYTIYESPAMSAVDKQMREHYESHVRNENSFTISLLQTILSQGWLKTQSNVKAPLSSISRKIINDIILMIQKRTIAFSTLDASYMTLLEYRLYVNHYRATDIIDGAQHTLNAGVDNVFVYKFPSDKPLVAELRKSLPSMGGGDINLQYVFDMSKEPYDFINVEYIEEDDDGKFYINYPMRVYVTNAIYKLLNAKHPEKSKDELCFIACNIYSILHMYFCYICETCYDDAFLSDCITMYESGKTHVSYDYFVAFYNTHKETNKITDLPDVSKYVSAVQKVYENVDDSTMPPPPPPYKRTIHVGGQKTLKRKRFHKSSRSSR